MSDLSTGLIPTKELSSDPTLIPAQAFRFGQVVKCRVIQAHHPSLQKITLSLRSVSSGVAEESTHNKKTIEVVEERNIQFGQVCVGVWMWDTDMKSLSSKTAYVHITCFSFSFL